MRRRSTDSTAQESPLRQSPAWAPAQSWGCRFPASLICYDIIDGLTAGAVAGREASALKGQPVFPGRQTRTVRREHRRRRDGNGPLPLLKVTDFSNDARTFAKRVPLRDPLEND